MRDQRIWVNEERTILLTTYASTETVTVAFREDPGHTWGPPITLTEEKT